MRCGENFPLLFFQKVVAAHCGDRQCGFRRWLSAFSEVLHKIEELLFGIPNRIQESPTSSIHQAMRFLMAGPIPFHRRLKEAGEILYP